MERDSVVQKVVAELEKIDFAFIVNDTVEEILDAVIRNENFILCGATDPSCARPLERLDPLDSWRSMFGYSKYILACISIASIINCLESELEYELLSARVLGNNFNVPGAHAPLKFIRSFMTSNFVVFNGLLGSADYTEENTFYLPDLILNQDKNGQDGRLVLTTCLSQRALELGQEGKWGKVLSLIPRRIEVKNCLIPPPDLLLEIFKPFTFNSARDYAYVLKNLKKECEEEK